MHQRNLKGLCSDDFDFNNKNKHANMNLSIEIHIWKECVQILLFRLPSDKSNISFRLDFNCIR